MMFSVFSCISIPTLLDSHHYKYTKNCKLLLTIFISQEVMYLLIIERNKYKGVEIWNWPHQIIHP